MVKKDPQGLLHVLGEKEKSGVFWTFPDKKDSAGIHEFEYQKNMFFWAMQRQGLSKKDQKIVSEVIDFLKERYLNSSGKFNLRGSAKNPISGHREPEINHPIGVSIIALGILNEGKFNKNLPEKEILFLSQLEKKQRALILSGMFHDFCEDEKGDEHTIRRLLKKLKFPKEEIEEIIATGQILTRQRGRDFRESSVDYIDRITHSGNDMAPFLKAADIIHNALSPHKESQKKKYKNCYLSFLFQSFTATEYLFPLWMKKQIFTENAYLKPFVKKILAEVQTSQKQLPRKCRNISGSHEQ